MVLDEHEISQRRIRSLELIRRYLGAMEQRDLPAARSCLGEGFRMTFPGENTFTEIEQLIDWASSRYREVSKTIEGLDVCVNKPSRGDDPTMTVYCFGTLSGRWPDGTEFGGIRFIDRFAVVNNTITEQWVWNDLAEVRAAQSHAHA